MKNEIKRHFYNGEHYELDKDNKRVVLKPIFFKQLKTKTLWSKFGFKKIGGSSIGDVLEVDKYKSQFVAFCRMSWIGIPILDRKYVDAGIAIEPKVIDAIRQSSGRDVQTFDAKEYNYDYFSSKDDVVGGLPDGYIEETKTVLEIKTTGKKNFEKWETWGVPTAYLKQAQLYAYLMGVYSFSIIATFLEETDYAEPENYPIKERKTKNWNFKVNMEQAKDDIDIVKAWYYQHTKSGISPQYDEVRDADLIEWLEVSSPTEWEELREKWFQSGKLVL